MIEVPLDIVEESDRFRLRRHPYPGIDLLAADIRQNGQATPVGVLPLRQGKHTLIYGCRRTAALKMLGKRTILARIFDISDEAAYDLAISENQHRDALTDLERAEVCLELHDRGIDNKEIAQRMGWKNDRSVRRYLHLARGATEPLKEKLQQRKIGFNAAVVFVGCGADLSEEQQREILDEHTLEGMTAEALKKRLLAASGPRIQRQAKKREPIKNLKNGGFVVRTVRLDADPSSIERGIDLLQSALRKARRLKKKLDGANVPAPRGLSGVGR